MLFLCSSCSLNSSARYRLYGDPVVVQRLAITSKVLLTLNNNNNKRKNNFTENSEGNSGVDLITDLTMESFVLDVARRATWASCAYLVPTVGAFCEVEIVDPTNTEEVQVEKCLGAVARDVFLGAASVPFPRGDSNTFNTLPDNTLVSNDRWSMSVQEILFLEDKHYVYEDGGGEDGPTAKRLDLLTPSTAAREVGCPWRQSVSRRVAGLLFIFLLPMRSPCVSATVAVGQRVQRVRHI